MIRFLTAVFLMAGFLSSLRRLFDPQPDANTFGSQYNSNIYLNLDTSVREIRLVHVEAARDVLEPLHCNLSIVSLDREPQYEALSYVWGDPNVRKPILLNGEPFSVTLNLEAALRALRLPDQVRTIWIDALCINQNQVEERNHQVSQMGRIYSGASTVIVWLGEESDDSDMAFKALEAMSKDENLHWDSNLQPSLDAKYLEYQYIQAVGRLLEREWWWRVWTVQERALAKQVVFVCGRRVFLGERLWKARWNASNHLRGCCNSHLRLSFESRLSDLLTRFEEISWLDIYRKGKEPYDLIIYLNMFRQRQATDPRDRVYGLLGLDPNPDALTLGPDYTKSTAEVYEATAIELARRSPRFELFSFVERSGSSIIEVPTWVPDWTSFREEILFQIQNFRLASLSIYKTATERPGSLISISPGKASVHGIVVDRIAVIADGEVPMSQTKDVRLDIYKRWNMLADSSGPADELYLNQNMSRREAFQQILVGGIFPAIDSMVGTRWSSADNAQGKSIFEKWWKWMKTSNLAHDNAEIAAGSHATLCATTHRRFFVTEKGYMGIGPAATLKSDLVVVIDGSHLPTIFRETSEIAEIDRRKESSFKVLGDSFVQGLVNGEAVAMINNGELGVRRFILV